MSNCVGKRSGNTPGEVNWQYAAIIDCGSSASRIFIYRWNKNDLHPSEAFEDQDQPGASLIKVFCGGEQEYKFSKKPGIATFHSNPEDVGTNHLSTLISFAQKKIPAALHEDTRIFLSATGGMRLLDESQQQRILAEACKYVKSESNFNVESCQYDFKVISGREEGLFGWIAANYLMTKLEKNNLEKNDVLHTLGFMEMGGASLQLATGVQGRESYPEESLISLRLRNTRGQNLEYHLFVSSWLGYGVDEALKHYANFLEQQCLILKDDEKLFKDPCHLKGFNTTVSVPAGKFLDSDGDFQTCVRSLNSILKDADTCHSDDCRFIKNGLSVDFSSSHFIATAEFWKIANEVYRLGGSYDYEIFRDRATEFCSQPWSQIVENFNNGRYFKRLALRELSTLCFRSAWMVSMLHTKFGIPHNFRADLRSLTENMDNNKDSAYMEPRKNYENALLLASTIDGFFLSWTLGQLLVYLSKNTVYSVDSQQMHTHLLPVGYGPANSEFAKTFTPYSDHSNHSKGVFLFLLAIAALLALILAKMHPGNPFHWKKALNPLENWFGRKTVFENTIAVSRNSTAMIKRTILRILWPWRKRHYGNFVLPVEDPFATGSFSMLASQRPSTESSAYKEPLPRILSMHDLQNRSRSTSPSRASTFTIRGDRII